MNRQRGRSRTPLRSTIIREDSPESQRPIRPSTQNAASSSQLQPDNIDVLRNSVPMQFEDTTILPQPDPQQDKVEHYEALSYPKGYWWTWDDKTKRCWTKLYNTWWTPVITYNPNQSVSEEPSYYWYSEDAWNSWTDHYWDNLLEFNHSFRTNTTLYDVFMQHCMTFSSWCKVIFRQTWFHGSSGKKVKTN